MSAAMASNSFHPSDNLSHSPSKPASPASPGPALFSASRSFINLNHSDGRNQPPVPKRPQHTPIEPPLGMTYADFLRTWNDSHVARWLTDIKCGCHEEAFKANDIRGDVVLELDQDSLQEMGISSIGDRLRITNAVKVLRQRVAGRIPANRTAQKASEGIESKSIAERMDMSGNKSSSRRLESVRPAPLQLNSSTNRSDLPGIAREVPDSARSVSHPPVRPLPHPNQTPPSNSSQSITPNSAHSVSSSHLRPKLPSIPPPPRVHPPVPPPTGRGQGRSLPAWTPSEVPAYTTQPPPPPPQTQIHLTSSVKPGDPRPGIVGGKPVARSTSPVPPARPRPNPPPGVHNRNGSFGLGTNSSQNKPNRPATNLHPYASAQASLHAPPNPSHTLSPIDESFSGNQSSAAGTQSPPTQAYTVGRGPFNPTSTSSNAYSLDDLRRKLVKFVLPEEGHTFTLDVATCNGGIEVLERVLKKFGKNNARGDGNLDVSQTGEGGLVVDGWGVYMSMGQDDGPGQPLTEAELLSICHAPDHPTRENGLVLRRIRSPGQSRNTKRASSISVLSGLGVRDPENVLEPPSPSTRRFSPAVQNAKRPSKLRNFFGQRPPSELITNHLTEYFPNTEKKVLARTARNSMMLRSGTLSARRDSAASFNAQLVSRFSGSTQGSGRHSYSPSRASISTLPPPVPEKSGPYETPIEDLPRMSLSTDDGRSVDLHIEETQPAVDRGPQLLPPIPFPTESLSESMEDMTGHQRRMSRAMSIASKRMSYMTELRSRRDRSDTASLMTVDEITANVESRRSSQAFAHDSDLDGWTKVDPQIEDMVPKAVAADDPEEIEEVEVEEEEEDDSGSEDSLDSEDETLREEEELSLDVDDDGCIRNVVGTKRANKWIKGALIGAGSFGKVYLGMDASTGFLMAVKQVELPKGSAPNQERKKSMLSALEREIELLKNLEHENIVQYLYSSLDDEFLNIFLEYVPGGSVTALLRNYGAFEEPLVKNFVRQILQGLDYLHERDIIHRDIKGANILVDNRGGIKISDFGISKKVDDNLLTGNRMNRPSLQGSVFWMAPEVVKQTGHTRKADIWSVGCLVVEMLTGEHPWAQLTQMQAIFKIGSSARPTIPSDISADAQDFLRRTFEINHEARPSATELLQHAWIASAASK